MGLEVLEQTEPSRGEASGVFEDSDNTSVPGAGSMWAS